MVKESNCLPLRFKLCESTVTWKVPAMHPRVRIHTIRHAKHRWKMRSGERKLCPIQRKGIVRGLLHRKLALLRSMLSEQLSRYVNFE